MNFVDSKVENYAQDHSQQPSLVVDHIENWTNEHLEYSRMISGPLQGAVLKLLARSVNAKRILEIGMFTGYSALTLAEELPEDGQLITMDIDTESEEIARKFFDRSEHGKKIDIIIGHALEKIPALDGMFDLVYIDADKENYLNYYEAIMPLVRSGGVIVADNVLWSSTVLDPKTPDAHALNEFNKRVSEDRRVMNVLLTLRDGLMVALKN